MQTFEQIQDDVWVQLKEVAGDDGFWTEQEVKDAINDAYIEIADETFCFKLESIIEVQVGIRTYKLPENYIIGSLYRVEFDNKRIYPVSSLDLDTNSETWRNEDGDPRNFIFPGDISATDEIVVYPNPATAGDAYNLASESEDYGVITTVGDDSYEEFTQEEGIVVATDGDAKFNAIMGDGPVLDIVDPDGNLKIFAARYPKRLFGNSEVFLHPASYNPKKVITKGALSILLAKDGEGKDIAKASYWNKRFNEAMNIFKRSSGKKFHRMRSISEGSIFNGLNLGEHYPHYPR